ncbi:MAG TPA: hypothetical protein VFV35_00185, partial [Acidimicrobiales bacterium]|nr:hypothetical protein [Acidimicrobiales bacterium]
MPESLDALRAAGATSLATTPTLDSIRGRVDRRRRRRRASLATVTAVAALTGLLVAAGAGDDDPDRRREVVVGTEEPAATCEEARKRPLPAPTVSTIDSRKRIWDTTLTLDPPAPGFEPRLSARDAVGRAAPPIAHATSIEALLADYVSPRSSATDGSAEAWAPAWVVIGRGVPVTPAIGTSCVLGTDIVAVDPTTGAQIGRTQIGRDIEMVRVLHADDRVVEVELAVPDEVPAGERLWADVVVRNIGR